MATRSIQRKCACARDRQKEPRSRLGVQLSVEPVQKQPLDLTAQAPPNLDAESKQVAKSQEFVQQKCNLALAFMIAGCTLFAAAFAIYVLYPAMNTLFGV